MTSRRDTSIPPLFDSRHKRPGLAALRLPDGELRIFEPDPAEGDPGRMYVLDVLGVSLLAHQRNDGSLYVHVDGDAVSRPVSPVLLVEVNNSGETDHSISQRSPR